MNNKNIIYCITGLNQGGAEKMLTQLVVHNLLREMKYESILILLKGGYYETLLSKNKVETLD